MNHREELLLRKIIKETVIQEGLWDDIKAKAGSAFDAVKGTSVGKFLGMQNKDPNVFYSYLDKLSPEERLDVQQSVETGDIAPVKSVVSRFVNPFDDGSPGEVTRHIRSNGRISFNSTQYDMIDLIEDVLRDEGFSSPVIAAAIVNAYFESGFNPNATGDGGHSIGLFQLNDAGGAGAGMSVESRKDPVVNTRKIAQVARRTNFMNVAEETDDIPTLAAAWSKYVERPADEQGNMRKRAAFSRQLFNLSDF